MSRTDPRRYTTTFAKLGRERKILIDYLRNNRTNTSISAFSPRARPGARVSMPVDWDDLKTPPEKWTLSTVPKRLNRLRVDPWARYWTITQQVSEASFKAIRLLIMLARLSLLDPQHTAHRPWPLSHSLWIMTQSWHDLLFAHWPVEQSALRRVVPADFELDLFDGAAWLSVVPFHMSNVSLRGIPPLPWLSAFPELNVRTYVRVADRPGVYFFSLDAARWPAVYAARVLLNLPYHLAHMTIERSGGSLRRYDSERRRRGPAAFKASYGPVGVPFTPATGLLDQFLTDRYCLYHHNHGGRPYRLEIHHRPWTLQDAYADIAINSMAAVSGLPVEGTPALLHFARRQDVVAWAPTKLR